jgi:hypothetical protein
MGLVASKVYETRPTNVADLQQQILVCIQDIPEEMLQRVMRSFPSRLQQCTEQHGGHLQSVVFKKIMTQMSSHGHGMHPLVLINFSTLP